MRKRRSLWPRSGRKKALYFAASIVTVSLPWNRDYALHEERSFTSTPFPVTEEVTLFGDNADYYPSGVFQHNNFVPDQNFLQLGLHGEVLNTTIVEREYSQIPRVYGPVRKAVNLKWYAYENICLNGADSYRYRGGAGEFEANLTRLGLDDNVTPPYRSTPFDWKNFEKPGDQVFLLRGTTVIVGCWRIARDRLQPSHFMFAHGKLYALLNDDKEPFAIDHVLFFQCPDIFQGHPHDFFQSVWKIIFSSGVKRGWFTSSTRFVTIGKEDLSPLYCVEYGMVDHSTGLFHGQNHKTTVHSWAGDVRQFVMNSNRHDPALPYHKPFTSRRDKTCSENIRVGIFQRTEGTDLRLFLNLDDVVDMMKGFSQDVQVFTVSSNSTFYEAWHYFNQFDIIIAPHGSHLTNGILIDFEKFEPAIIEVTATCINADFKRNLEKYFAHYELSTGHMVADSGVQKFIRGCEGYSVRGCSYTANCTFSHARSAVQDVYVSTEKLRESVKRVIDWKCPLGQPIRSRNLNYIR